MFHMIKTAINHPINTTLYFEKYRNSVQLQFYIIEDTLINPRMHIQARQ